MLPSDDTVFVESPLLILLSFDITARGSVWRDPGFIIQMSREDNPGQGMNIIISITTDIRREWYTFLSTQIKTITNDQKVILKQPLQFETKVTYIGEKTHTFYDIIKDQDGVVLATLQFVYGLSHKTDRTLQVLSKRVRSKVKYIENNEKPKYIEIKDEGDNRSVSMSDTVTVHNVDSYRHANFSFYFYQPLTLFTQLNQVDKKLKRFTMLYRRESHLGDELKSVAWRDQLTGAMCCKTNKGQTLVNYSQAEYYNQQSRL